MNYETNGDFWYDGWCVTNQLLLFFFTDFMAWKEQFEKNTNTWFVKNSGKKLSDNSATTYYYCNRSGYFKSKGTGLRHLKSQGTSKVDAHCTASLTVNREDPNASIKVQVHSTHYGHEEALGHIRLSDSDRLAIAGQLTQGVEFQHILDKI